MRAEVCRRFTQTLLMEAKAQPFDGSFWNWLQYPGNSLNAAERTSDVYLSERQISFHVYSALMQGCQAAQTAREAAVTVFLQLTR